MVAFSDQVDYERRLARLAGSREWKGNGGLARQAESSPEEALAAGLRVFDRGPLRRG